MSCSSLYAPHSLLGPVNLSLATRRIISLPVMQKEQASRHTITSPRSLTQQLPEPRSSLTAQHERWLRVQQVRVCWLSECVRTIRNIKPVIHAAALQEGYHRGPGAKRAPLFFKDVPKSRHPPLSLSLSLSSFFG